MHKYQTRLHTKLQKERDAKRLETSPDIMLSDSEPIPSTELDVLPEEGPVHPTELDVLPEEGPVHPTELDVLPEEGPIPSTELDVLPEEGPVTVEELPPAYKLHILEKKLFPDSGIIEGWSNIFNSYESASEYIISRFNGDGIAQEHWSENQYDCTKKTYKRHHKTLQRFPRPTMEFASTMFSPQALAMFVKNHESGDQIYGPFDANCMDVPYSIVVYYWINLDKYAI